MMAVPQHLIDKYRDINVNHDWWDYTYDDFKQRMSEVGIEVDKMYFSGFWSQGDGACFEGSISDMTKFMDAHFKPTEFTSIRKLLDVNGDVYVKCRHSGHYYHEHCTTFDIGSDSFANCLSQPTEFHEQMVIVLDSILTDQLIDFEARSVEIFKGYMKQLYRELSDEYDGLTTDESVADSIIANDLLTIEEGE